MNIAAKFLGSFICCILIMSDINSYAATGQKDSALAPSLPNSFPKEAAIVAKAVFKIECPISNNENSHSQGTGFLHKSGLVLTAAHVVNKCDKFFIIKSDGTQVSANLKSIDPELDLALLEPSSKLGNVYLDLYTEKHLQIGDQVATWGYPGGYNGRMPLLTIGYLSGVDAQMNPSGKIIGRLAVNAAFNSGNSGGPLIDVESGKVVGVVDSKLAPISEKTKQEIKLLKKMNGMTYNFTTMDGKNINISPNDFISDILDDLRNQIQLVIGYAVLSQDIVGFIKSNNIEP